MIKLFKMNETDWIAAKTLEDAKQGLADTIGDGKVTPEFEDEWIENPHELSDADLDEHKLTDEDAMDEFLRKRDSDSDLGQSIDAYYATCPTFRQALKTMEDNGIVFPCHFASSEH